MPARTVTDDAPEAGRPRASLLVPAVLALAGLIVLLPVGRMLVWDDNEARYMVLARDILEHGRWLIPELRGAPYVNKPQLFFWSIALTSLPGGRVTELTGTLPAALSAVAAVVGVLAIGARAWGRTAGLVAALVLTTMVGFVIIAPRAQPDVMVMAWATWALYWLLAARRGAWRVGPVLGFWACVAGAVMTKGPPGLLALGAGLVSVGATYGYAGIRRLRPATGFALVCLLTSPWWLTYVTRARGAVVTNVFVGEYATWVGRWGLLTRLETVAVVAYVLPWSTFLIGAILWWRRAEPDDARRLIGWWAFSTWAMIGLSGMQRVRYLMPIYPALALLVAEFVVHGGRERGAALLRRATLGYGALALIVAGFALSPALSWIEGDARPWVPTGRGEIALVTALLVVSAVVAAVAARRGAFLVGVAAIALGVAGVLVVEGVRQPARFSRTYDVRPLMEVARRFAPPGAPVRTYGGVWLSYDFYLGRAITEVDEAEASRVLALPPSGVLLMHPDSWDALRPTAGDGWRVVARRDGPRRTLVIGGGHGG